MSTVLIVDRDKDSRNLLKEILEDAGYAVYAAEDTSDGLSILQRGIAIDTVLCATVAGSTERLDLVEKICAVARERELPVIALTSSLRTHEGAKAEELGCVSFIAKPVEEEQLLEKIKQYTQHKG